MFARRPPLPISSRQTAALSRVWVALLLLSACESERPAASPAVRQPSAAATTQGAARKSASAIRDDVAKELWVLQALDAVETKTAKRLGQLNGMMQSRSYALRIPVGARSDQLRDNLTQTATQFAIELTEFTADADVERPPLQPNLRPGQRWQLTREQLFGLIRLTLEVRGSEPLIARFIDGIPKYIERLVVITGKEELGPGHFRLQAEAYFEHPVAERLVQTQWPDIATRLADAGWPPGDPDTAALLRSDEGRKLLIDLEQARQRFDKAMRPVLTSADFPRWLLRMQFFADRSTAAMAVSGRDLLGLN
jgi:hypothetical protein